MSENNASLSIAIGEAQSLYRDARRFPWTPEEEGLLGAKPDAEVARLLNRSKGAVGLRRYLKGIPVFGSRDGHAQISEL